MSISMSKRELPVIFDIFRKKKKEVERKFVVDNSSVPKKTVYEKIEHIEMEIESKLAGIELAGIEEEKAISFKERYNKLKEEANNQIRKEKNKDIFELFIKDSNYYYEALNEFLEVLDATLAKYTYIKRLKEFEINDENIDISINEVLYFRCDYISLNILFNEEEKIYIENRLSNIYFDLILREIVCSNDSKIFNELNLIEKKRVQLVLMNRLRDNISKTKIRREHIEELAKNLFSLEDFRFYLRLIKKYANYEIVAHQIISNQTEKSKILKKRV